MALLAEGLNDCQISRLTGIPRGTIMEWRHKGPSARSETRPAEVDCPRCGKGGPPQRAYAYLLGLYLGDGCISPHRRTCVLRIALDQRYPGIIDEAVAAVAAMRPSIDARVWRIQKAGCIEVACGWKHWPCLFPQHGLGPKHRRRIQLADWQTSITSRHPFVFLRGLIHSDGCRTINRVRRGKYAYPRYLFSNESYDILAIFGDACEQAGVDYRYSKRNTISIAKRDAVALLDAHIGPKA